HRARRLLVGSACALRIVSDQWRDCSVTLFVEGRVSMALDRSAHHAHRLSRDRLGPHDFPIFGASTRRDRCLASPLHPPPPRGTTPPERAHPSRGGAAALAERWVLPSGAHRT